MAVAPAARLGIVHVRPDAETNAVPVLVVTVASCKVKLAGRVIGTDTLLCASGVVFETVTWSVTSEPARADSLGVEVTASPS